MSASNRPVAETSDMTLTARGRTVVVVSESQPRQGGLPSRMWGLAQGLIAAGHNVHLLTPEHLGLVKKAEVIVTDGWELVGKLPPALPGHLVIDMSAPHLLMTRSEDERREKIAAKLAALRRASYITCTTELMQNYTYGWLLMAGIDLRSTPPIAVVPFPLPPEPERLPLADGPVFLYAGDFAPWRNPAAGLHALLDVLEARGKGKLISSGDEAAWRHAGGVEALETLKQRMIRSDRASLVPGVSAYYPSASLIWDVLAPNPTASMTYEAHIAHALYMGRPVVLNEGSALARALKNHDIGWTVNPADVKAMSSLVHAILNDGGTLQQRGRNAYYYASEHLRWTEATDPLNYFVRQPDQYAAKKMPFTSRLDVRK